MSLDTSSMISSTLLVEWMRLVTACRLLRKASRLVMSPGAIDWGLSTALITSCPVGRPSQLSARAGSAPRSAITSVPPRPAIGANLAPGPPPFNRAGTVVAAFSRHAPARYVRAAHRAALLCKTRAGMPGCVLGPPVGAAAQSAIEDICPESALREQECGRGASPATLAVQDIFAASVEHFDRVADFRQRDVDRTRQLVVLVLGRVARVDPLAARRDLRARVLHGHALEQRLLEQLVEVVLREPEQRALGQHRHGGVALRVRDQRLLAERVAALELGEVHRYAADVSLDAALPRLEDVVEIASVPFADDDLATLRAHALEALQHLVDVRRRELRERAGLEVVDAEHPRQDRPIAHRQGAVLGRLRTRFLAGGELIPGEHDVEEVFVDADQLDIGDRLGGGERGLATDRVPRLRSRADDDIRAAVAEDQGELALEEEHELAADALDAERVEGLAHPLDHAQLGELGEALRRQRREGLEPFQHLETDLRGGHARTRSPGCSAASAAGIARRTPRFPPS